MPRLSFHNSCQFGLRRPYQFFSHSVKKNQTGAQSWNFCFFFFLVMGLLPFSGFPLIRGHVMKFMQPDNDHFIFTRFFAGLRRSLMILKQTFWGWSIAIWTSRDGSVDMAVGYEPDDRDAISGRGKRHTSAPALGPIHLNSSLGRGFGTCHWDTEKSAVSEQNSTIFWNKTSCNLVYVDRRFGGMYLARNVGKHILT